MNAALFPSRFGGKRCVLCRLDDQGADAWVHDPVAAELMEGAGEKYAAMAVRHGLDLPRDHAGQVRRSQRGWTAADSNRYTTQGEVLAPRRKHARRSTIRGFAVRLLTLPWGCSPFSLH